MESPVVVIPKIAGLRIVRVLGRGGMGAVFLAVDDATHRAVALKVIVGDLARELAARTRFEREIAAVSAIHHRNIVRLLRAGESDGVPYALFERVRGRTLPRLGAQPWPVAVDIGRQLAHAIAAVHAAHWLHRDLKPSNVMVGDHGLVTLIDFGLARHVTDPEVSGMAPSPHDAALTLGGTVVGTRRYLAPELLHGRTATRASDVYSLGLTLHQLLGGEIHEEGRHGELTQILPRPLARSLRAMLADEPERRPTASVVAAMLDRLPGRPARFRSGIDDDIPTWPVLADRQATRGSAG